MKMQQIETAFRNTLKHEGITGSVTILKDGVTICVESQTDHDKAQALMAKVPSVTYVKTEHYEADEVMPAEWYLRFSYN